jgi:hypothetical protein
VVLCCTIVHLATDITKDRRLAKAEHELDLADVGNEHTDEIDELREVQRKECQQLRQTGEYNLGIERIRVADQIRDLHSQLDNEK